MSLDRLIVTCFVLLSTVLAGCQSSATGASGSVAASGGFLALSATIDEAQRVCTNAGPRFANTAQAALGAGYVSRPAEGPGEQAFFKETNGAKLTLRTAPNGFRTCKLLIRTSTSAREILARFEADSRVSKKPLGTRGAFTYLIGNSGHHVDFRGPYTASGSSITAVQFVVSQVRT